MHMSGTDICPSRGGSAGSGRFRMAGIQQDASQQSDTFDSVEGRSERGSASAAAWAYNTAQLQEMFAAAGRLRPSFADAAKAEAPKRIRSWNGHRRSGACESDQAELKSNMKYLTDRIGPRLTVLHSSIAPAIGCWNDSRNWDFRMRTWSPGRCE